jgi:hypothetical protein
MGNTEVKEVGIATELYAAVSDTGMVFLAARDPNFEYMDIYARNPDESYKLADHTKEFVFRLVASTTDQPARALYIKVARGERMACHIDKAYYDTLSDIQYAPIGK